MNKLQGTEKRACSFQKKMKNLMFCYCLKRHERVIEMSERYISRNEGILLQSADKQRSVGTELIAEREKKDKPRSLP